MFKPGQKVKVIDDTYGGVIQAGLKRGDIVTVASDDGEFTSIRESNDSSKRFFSSRFEAVPEAPKYLYLEPGHEPVDAESDLAEYCEGTEIEVYRFVRTAKVKLNPTLA
jgi:hypothetical protein